MSIIWLNIRYSSKSVLKKNTVRLHACQEMPREVSSQVFFGKYLPSEVGPGSNEENDEDDGDDGYATEPNDAQTAIGSQVQLLSDLDHFGQIIARNLDTFAHTF